MAKYKPECVQPEATLHNRGLRTRACILPSSPIRTKLDPVSNLVHSVDLHDTQRHTILPHQTNHSHDS